MSCTPNYLPISMSMCPKSRPKPAPSVNIGVKIPIGIGQDIERMIKKNFKRQYVTKLNIMLGCDHMSPSKSIFIIKIHIIKQIIK